MCAENLISILASLSSFRDEAEPVYEPKHVRRAPAKRLTVLKKSNNELELDASHDVSETENIFSELCAVEWSRRAKTNCYIVHGKSGACPYPMSLSSSTCNRLRSLESSIRCED